MKTIPDVTPTELTRCVVAVGVVGVWLLMTFLDMKSTTLLDLAFGGVMSLLGISVAKPAVSNILSKVYGKPPSPNPDK